jgi:hypothetical protein
MPDRNITFEIKEHLGTIAQYGTGWNKELNIISWNGGAPKFDIRDWDEYHEKMSRGVTLTQWEMRKLADLYIARNNDKAIERGKQIEAQRNARKEASYQRKEAVQETPLPEAPLTMETEAIDGLVDVETGEVLEHQSQVLPDVPQPESEPTDAEPADAELADAAEEEMKDDF